MRLLGRGLHTLIKSILFSSPTDVGSHSECFLQKNCVQHAGKRNEERETQKGLCGGHSRGDDYIRDRNAVEMTMVEGDERYQ